LPYVSAFSSRKFVNPVDQDKSLAASHRVLYPTGWHLLCNNTADSVEKLLWARKRLAYITPERYIERNHLIPFS
jgi:hypothetical protein